MKPKHKLFKNFGDTFLVIKVLSGIPLVSLSNKCGLIEYSLAQNETEPYFVVIDISDFSNISLFGNGTAEYNFLPALPSKLNPSFGYYFYQAII